MNRTYSHERDFVLLTGACGFVGRYLLKDLLLAGRQVAVVVRSRGRQSAIARVKKVLDFCQETAQRSFPMPRVIDWDICDSAVSGINREDLHWLTHNISSVLHSAASVRFTLDNKAEEPFASNVGGTRKIIDLATDLGPVDFHHVSTAYVCGDRQGKALENETTLPTFKNVYEESKFLAEEQLREASHEFKSLTIYRPSIVVGDSESGYASAFQTIYGGLRLASTMPESHRNDVESLFEWLGISGEATKNLVPVDWVSRAIVEVFQHPNLHNKTYHLTNPKDVSVEKLAAAMVSAIQKETNCWQSMKSSASEMVPTDDIKRVFLDSFQSYFSNDPIFDRTQIDAALPNLSVPEMSPERLERMFQYAIRQKFMESDLSFVPSGTTSTRSIENLTIETSLRDQIPVFPIAWSLTIFNDSAANRPLTESTRESKYLFESSRSNFSSCDNNQMPRVFAQRQTLRLLASGETSFKHSLRLGQLVVMASGDFRDLVILQLRELLDSIFGQTLLTDADLPILSLEDNRSLCGQGGER
jgi:thioester reductase-like protein